MNEHSLQLSVLRSVDRDRYDVVGHEWHVNGTFTQDGVGDILLKRKHKNKYVVIEVKFLDMYSTGKTARVRRNRHRKKVKEQAWKYGSLVHSKHTNSSVLVCIYTNEIGGNVLGKIGKSGTVTHYTRQSLKL